MSVDIINSMQLHHCPRRRSSSPSCGGRILICKVCADGMELGQVEVSPRSTPRNFFPPWSSLCACPSCTSCLCPEMAGSICHDSGIREWTTALCSQLCSTDSLPGTGGSDNAFTALAYRFQ